MAAKLDFKTLFIKLNNIFPKDMYIFHNWCAIAGSNSETENIGFYMCILDQQARDLLNGLFPNNPILYVKSVRETKTDISKVEEILDNNVIDKLNSTVNTFMEQYNSYENWDSFNFTPDDVAALFDNNESLVIFKDDDTKSELVISKSLFPLVTSKTIDTVKYAYDSSNDELHQIIVDYRYDLFQLIMKYLFLKI